MMSPPMMSPEALSIPAGWTGYRFSGLPLTLPPCQATLSTGAPAASVDVTLLAACLAQPEEGPMDILLAMRAGATGGRNTDIVRASDCRGVALEGEADRDVRLIWRSALHQTLEETSVRDLRITDGLPAVPFSALNEDQKTGLDHLIGTLGVIQIHTGAHIPETVIESCRRARFHLKASDPRHRAPADIPLQVIDDLRTLLAQLQPIADAWVAEGSEYVFGTFGSAARSGFAREIHEHAALLHDLRGLTTGPETPEP